MQKMIASNQVLRTTSASKTWAESELNMKPVTDVVCASMALSEPKSKSVLVERILKFIVPDVHYCRRDKISDVHDICVTQGSKTRKQVRKTKLSTEFDPNIVKEYFASWGFNHVHLGLALQHTYSLIMGSFPLAMFLKCHNCESFVPNDMDIFFSPYNSRPEFNGETWWPANAGPIECVLRMSGYVTENETGVFEESGPINYIHPLLGKKVQIVRIMPRGLQPADEVCKNSDEILRHAYLRFDFTCCMVGWDGSQFCGLLDEAHQKIFRSVNRKDANEEDGYTPLLIGAMKHKRGEQREIRKRKYIDRGFKEMEENKPERKIEGFVDGGIEEDDWNPICYMIYSAPRKLYSSRYTPKKRMHDEL